MPGKMLPSSVRYLATTTQSAGLLSLSTSASVAGFCVAQRQGLQPRWYSSSKTSNSSGRKKVASDSVTAPVESRSSKASSEKRKRKSKAALNTPSQNLPSVPSTQHLSDQAIALTSFFSLHRPISVTDTFPKVVSDDAFASIFASKAGTSDVISTLSDAIDTIEGPVAKLVISERKDGDVSAGDVREYQPGDNALPGLWDQIKAMSGRFVPFTSPSTPAENDPSAVRDYEDVAADADLEPQHRQYKAVFTIDETTNSDGRVEIVAHSPQLWEEEQEGSARRPGRASRWDMISVVRIRKLKMKKKKYKKLMKRTRNIRRKLDRL